MMPRPGQVVHIGRDCGVPYTFRPIYFAVGEVVAHQPHAEGAWLVGYELDNCARAVARREIYVGQLAGLRDVTAQILEHRRRAAVALHARRPTVPMQRINTTPATTTSGKSR